MIKLTKSQKTRFDTYDVSNKIRFLSFLGYTIAEIHSSKLVKKKKDPTTEVRYQHVRNVMKTPVDPNNIPKFKK